MDSNRRNRRSGRRSDSPSRQQRLSSSSAVKSWPDVIEALERRLLLRNPIPVVPHPVPAKPGPDDHAPVYQVQQPNTGQQRWPINFDASHVRELAPETIDPATGISPPHRVLDPADIVWVNRANTTTGGAGDTDNFGAVFGTVAPAARAVVDAVIVRYEQMIGSFDYPSAGQHYSLTLSVGAAGSGFGASASLATSLGGKPFSGSISMGGGSGGGTNTDHGWFLDPTPFENGEFEGNIVNAFAGDAPSTSPAFNKGDFFTVVAAETTHCMGLFNTLAGWTSHTTNTGIFDNITGVGSYWTFVGPDISHLGTSDNAGSGDFHQFIHSAEGASNINFAAQFWRGAEDQGNAFYEFGRRYLVNNTFSLMFHDAYGYASVNPAQFGTMYTILQSNGTLLVRGSSAVSNDLIYVDASGANLVISVDVGTDVGGTGAFAGDQSLPAFVTVVPIASVSSISVQAGQGNDIVRIENNGGKTTNVDGGPGDDFTDFSFGNRYWDNIQGFSNVFGGDGTDSIFMYDTANNNPDTYTIDAAEVNRPFFGGMFYGADIENLTVWAGIPVNTVNIPSTYFANGTFLNNAGGDDIVNIGESSDGVQSIGGYLQIQNDPAFSVITVNDTGDPTARNATQDTVVLGGSPFGRITGLAPATIDYQYLDTNSLSLITGGGNDTVNILRDGKPFNLSNSTGAGDIVNVGNNATGMQEIFGALTMVNPPSFDVITFDDAADAVGRNFTHTIVNISGSNYGQLTGLAPVTILYKVADTASTTYFAGSGADTANFVETAPGIPGIYRQSAGFDTMNVNTDNVGSSRVDFPDTERLAALNVGAGGLVNMLANGNHVLSTRALSVNATGKIDMLDNDMILDYSGASQLAAVQALINAGRTGGTWLGNGITSTNARTNVNHNTTLGAMEATDFKAIYGGGATFDGETIDTTAVLVKYTYYGDADFNGKVNFDDYVRTDSGFNNHRTGWVNGDFNGNGVVNFDDYVLIDQAFNTQGAPL
jgi:hypothetical protein